MTRETYAVAHIAVHLSAGVLAGVLVLLYSRFRRRLSWTAALTLMVATFVFIESATFPFWFLVVKDTVPIRDEGLAVALEHLFIIGPCAAIALLMSLFQREIRWLGSGLCLSFVLTSPIVYLLEQL